MKKTLFLLLTMYTLMLSETLPLRKLSLIEYAEIVSSAAKINVLIDNRVPAKEISFFIPQYIKPNEYIDSFRSLLSDSNLILLKKPGYYYVTAKKEYLPTLRSYRFQFLNVDEVKFLTNVFPGVKFQYFSKSNVLFYISNKRLSDQIHTICKSLDIPYLSQKISLTIFTIDLEKLRSDGFLPEKIGFDLSNILTLTQSSLSLDMDNLFTFKATLDLLHKQKVIDVLQNPVLYLIDGKKTTFKSVKNLPVLQNTTSIQDNKITTQQNINYRDIGFQISINPVVKKDIVYMDINITSETLDNISETPTTNKLFYSNTIKLKKGTALLLTGFNLRQENIEKYRVPILAYLPYINPLFKSESKTSKSQILSILIEAIE